MGTFLGFRGSSFISLVCNSLEGLWTYVGRGVGRSVRPKGIPPGISPLQRVPFAYDLPTSVCRWLIGLNFWGPDFSSTTVNQVQSSSSVFLHKIDQR